MSAIFLSASVPIKGRGNYYETADPFLIQFAVRELVMAVIRDFQIVWGGHPAITPMIWTICKDLDANYSKSCILYQSRFFKEQFPVENEHFKNVNYINAVPDDLEASILLMRETMLSRGDLKAAVFIGGMEGVETEYEIFTRNHPEAEVLAVAAPGGAAMQLSKKIGGLSGSDLNNVDFSKLFFNWLKLVKKAEDKDAKTEKQILLIDDNEAIIAVTKNLLKQLGYKVISDTSCEGAIRAFKNAPNSFNLVIADMAMPEMAGDKLVQEISKVRSDIAIITLSTGETTDLKKAKKNETKRNLLIPFTKTELTNTVRKILEEE